MGEKAALHFCTHNLESWRVLLGVDLARSALFKEWALQEIGREENVSIFYEVSSIHLDKSVAALQRAARDKDVWIDGPPGLHTRTAFALGIIGLFIGQQTNDPRLLSLALGDLTSGVHVAVYDEVIRLLEPGLQDDARDAWQRLLARAYAPHYEGAAEKVRLSDQKHAKEFATFSDKGAIHEGTAMPLLKPRKRKNSPQVRTLFAP